MVTIGGGCTSKTNPVSGSDTYRTVVSTLYPFPTNANISNFCVYSTTQIYAKMKIFRDSGSNWEYVGQSGQFTVNATSSGSISTDVDVLSGDLLCLAYRTVSGSGSTYNMNGDYDAPYNTWSYFVDSTSDIVKTTDVFPRFNATSISIQATYTVTAGIPIKINIGDTWKDVDAVKINIGDSWKTVVGIQQNIGDTWKTVL